MNRVYKDDMDDLIVETDSYLIYKENMAGGYSINNDTTIENNWEHFPNLKIPGFSYKKPNYQKIETYLNRYFKLKSFW